MSAELPASLSDWFPANPFALLPDPDPRAPVVNAKWLWRAALTSYKLREGMDHDLALWGFPAEGILHLDLAGEGIDTQAMVAVRDETVLVAFRGTEPLNVKDWIIDARFSLVPGPGGRVHRGFSESLARGGEKCLVRRLAGLAKPGRRLWLTGHSLGGALATLAAAELAAQGLGASVGGVFTFGSPRVGDQGFATAYDAALRDRTWRLVNEDDFVAHLPPLLPEGASPKLAEWSAAFHYRHVGRHWRLGPEVKATRPPPDFTHPRLDMKIEAKLRAGLRPIVGWAPPAKALNDHLRLNYQEKLWALGEGPELDASAE